MFPRTMGRRVRLWCPWRGLVQLGLLQLHPESVLARLEAAVILPHGDFALDPTLVPANTIERQAADEVAQAAAEVGDWLGHHIDPDLIYLSTPHGIALSNNFALYLGSTASGGADIGKDLHNSTVRPYHVNLPRIELEPRLSSELVSELTSLHLNVSGIQVSAENSFDTPLQWAEVIPLLLIPPRQRRQTYEPPGDASLWSTTKVHRHLKERAVSTSQRRHLILSHPLRRYTASPDMVPELVQLGRLLRRWLDARPEKITVVISGDMSHTHRADGPYGYSDQSAVFDQAVGVWAADPCRQAAALLGHARSLQPQALSCGFTGMVMLHGILCSNDDNTAATAHGAVLEWDAHVWANRNVTYYGMMVASYERIH